MLRNELSYWTAFDRVQLELGVNSAHCSLSPNSCWSLCSEHIHSSAKPWKEWIICSKWHIIQFMQIAEVGEFLCCALQLWETNYKQSWVHFSRGGVIVRLCSLVHDRTCRLEETQIKFEVPGQWSELVVTRDARHISTGTSGNMWVQ